MKNPNPNANPAETPAKQKPMIFSDDNQPPTHEQLAMIAATLAGKTNEAPDKLVHAALEIWHAAGLKLAYMPSVSIITASIDCFEAGVIISRDKFFKKLLPASKKYRTYEVARVGKVFIRHLYCKKFGKEPSDKEFTDFYSPWNAGLKEEAEDLALDFGMWYRKYVSEVRSAAGKKPRKKNRKARPPVEKLKAALLT
jgi:hypothetical protein